MEVFNLQLVKDIPGTFQNKYFICGILFGILSRARLQKIHGNQKYVLGLHTPLEMKCVTTPIQSRTFELPHHAGHPE